MGRGWHVRRWGSLLRLKRKHVYLSTGCFHGEHEYCQSKTGLKGQKKPASCKFCCAGCVCWCHENREKKKWLTGERLPVSMRKDK